MTRKHGFLIALLVAAVGGLWWCLGSRDSAPKPAVVTSTEGQRPSPPPRSKAFGKPDKDVRAQAKASIRGVVRDTNGRPIAGANLCARTSSDEIPTHMRRQPACTLSDPQGAYHLDGLAPLAYALSASAKGHVPAYYEDPQAPAALRHRIGLHPGRTREGIDVVLPTGGVAVRGVVKDISGGPIADAWVGVTKAGWSEASAFAGALTNDEGEFEVWAAAGRVQVNATASGYTAAYEHGVAPGQTFELFLTPASTLVGKVVFAESGEVVPGARVTARLSETFARDIANTLADENGAFRIDGLEPGSYKLEATTPELYGLSAESIHVGLVETSEPVVVRVHPAFFVEGRVLVANADGTPCPDGSVMLKDTREDLRERGQTEPDGSVRLRALQPGTYDVTVDCDGYVSKPAYPQVVIATQSLTDLTWEVDEGLTIRGKVVHPDGTPVAGVSVSAQPKSDAGEPGARLTNAFGHETDEGGNFELGGLLPGAYVLGCYSDELPSPQPEPEVTLKSNRDLDGVRIVLPATGAIRGVVRDERGAVLAAIKVETLADAGDRQSTTTADDGSFVFEHIVTGPVRVRARGPNWGDAIRGPGQTDDDVQGQRVTVEQGRTVEVDLVVESHAGTIRGKVVDDAGGALSDAFVDVQRESDSAAASSGRARQALHWGSWWRDPILTDVEGRFELAELAPGRYTLRAYRMGGGEGVLEGVEVGSDVTIEVQTPGSLAGTVRAAGACPLSCCSRTPTPWPASA